MPGKQESMTGTQSRRQFLAGSVHTAFATLMSGTDARAAADQLLDDLARRCFHYFREQSDQHTDISRDRAHANGSRYPSDGRYVGSTGATGYALTSLCIGAERGWIPRQEARERVRGALSSYASGPVANEHGWFYHFVYSGKDGPR
jgi:hypothetical protein